MACNTQILNQFTGFITIITASVIFVNQVEQAIRDNFKPYLQPFALNDKGSFISDFKFFAETMPEVQNQKLVLDQFVINKVDALPGGIYFIEVVSSTRSLKTKVMKLN